MFANYSLCFSFLGELNLQFVLVYAEGLHLLKNFVSLVLFLPIFSRVISI